MTPPEETNKVLINHPKKREIYILSDQQFRIIILNKFSELQGHSERQLNKIGGETPHKQNEKCN